MKPAPLLTTVISNITYLLHPQILGTVQEDVDPDAILPVTLLDTDEIFSEGLERILRLFDSYDDVFTKDFGFALVEKPGTEPANKTKPENVTVMLSSRGVEDEPGNSLSNLPSGPYILHGKDLHPAYRLYNDELAAFAFGVVSDKYNETNNFLDLSSLNNDTYHPVAVPSRLYYKTPSNSKPLSGVRISIPESAGLAGVPNTLSSKSWASLYPDPEAAHSAFTKSLLDNGAIIVGKSKVSQFGAGKEWADVLQPKNPRVDGKQDAGGAGAGAAAAMAGYDWVQYAVDEDAIDGVHERAAKYGVYALRTTSGVVSLDGLQLSAPNYSTFALTGRDLNKLPADAQAFGVAGSTSARPKRLIFPVDLVAKDDQHKDLTEQFVATLENELGQKAERLNLTDIWHKKKPCDADGQEINDFLGNAPYRASSYDFYHNYDKFRSAFHSKFGEDVSAEPIVQQQWDTGKNVTDKEYATLLKRIDLFGRWFNKKVMAIDGSTASLVILPAGTLGSGPLDGLRPELLSPILGLPQLTVPSVTQIPTSDSKLPISSAVLGAKGDDIMLTQFVLDAIGNSFGPTEIQTGPITFPDPRGPPENPGNRTEPGQESGSEL